MVGVSGGPDSIALIHLLKRLETPWDLHLVIAHLDHQIRQSASKKDQQFVKTLSKKLCLPCLTASADIPKLSKKWKRSLEETGRLVRYAFFKAACQSMRAHKIVTAHTLNDQAETMLMRMIRGSGIKGLGGLRPILKEGPCRILRPLIEIEKKDLIHFLVSNHIPYQCDSTNQNTFFLRNKIRRRLLPLLERNYNPRIIHALGHLQETSSLAWDFLTRFIKISYDDCAQLTGKKILKLSITKWACLHPFIQREVLMKIIEEKKGNLKKIDYHHVGQLLDLILSDHGKRTLLPGNLEVQKHKQTLLFF